MIKKFTPNKQGIILLELIIILTIVSILGTITTTNLFSSQYKATLQSSINTLVSDLNHQRLKAITGDTGGDSVTKNYGIFFGSNSYVLFSGTTYSPGDSSNFIVALSDNLIFINNFFNQSQIVFSSGNGEIVNFSSSANSIGITDQSTQVQKTIIINKLGSIINVD